MKFKFNTGYLNEKIDQMKYGMHISMNSIINFVLFVDLLQFR